jgi:ureidoglycolate lyase
MALPVRELSAEAFRPYGRVIQLPDREHDAFGERWRWWAETVLLPTDGRAFGVGFLELRPGPLRFDWAERHMRTVEAVIAGDRECLVYVGPPEHPEEPGRLPGLDRFEVFRIPPGNGVAMDPGVWHGAPLAPAGPTTAVVLILEGTGREDVTIVRFEDDPVEIAD